MNTSNLNGTPLVKSCATIVFAGVSGFTEADISGNSAFGLGTAPDSLHHVPAPSGVVLLAAGGGMLLGRRRR